MCKVLMSIKPEYVDEILSGRKKYEYRKTRLKRTNIDKIIIYCTSPIMKVVAEIEVLEIIEKDPERLWKITKKYSGISKSKYEYLPNTPRNEYFENKNTAIAYKLGEIIKYNEPKKLKDIGISSAPQSFVYVD